MTGPRKALEGKTVVLDEWRDRLAAKVAKREVLGEDDDYEQHCIIVFDKRFHGSNQVYTYVAIKCDNDRWYTTGRQERGFTWEELAEFLYEGVEEIYVVTEVEKVYPSA